MAERAERIAQRLLSGSGAGVVTAYRLEGQPMLDAIAHGVASDGSLVVAAVARPDSEIFAVAPVDVRLDITMEAPELDVRVVAASLHLLGSLRWLPRFEPSDAAAIDRLPEHIAEIALAPGGRVGVVHATSALVHESAGVTRVGVRRAAEGVLATSRDRVHEQIPAMLDLARSTDRDRLSVLADAVIGGYRNGRVLLERPTVGACAAAVGKTFVIDVDTDGLTLMHIGEKQTTVVLALFGAEALVQEPGTTVDQCRAKLTRLLAA
ncbi:MAG TPA: hypothetical protein H9830_13745 [Candidatus Agrococcus pullicola]|uniref:Uncharacterized protein n=1 Tax=Candidatus Agrococcus pullicola TaxID=2838429 RepID=A0A9D1YXX8_9MICO|nr:hypothetical protein [Candidatus Agrococcus pullicola]